MDGVSMPAGGDIFDDVCLFGVGIRIASDSQDALAAALALYPPDEGAAGGLSHSICITFQSILPGATLGQDSFSVAQGRLTQQCGAIRIEADGRAGIGTGFFPAGMDLADGPFAEMVHTLVLFLVAHSGRTPIHASAIMLGDRALVLAGKSGSGKSSLALAADQAGLAVLSDDTIYIETDPALRVWASPRAIHVFEKDAPPDTAGLMRYRSGRWKRALPITAPRSSADRAVLCILERGSTAGLEPIAPDAAVDILTRAPEPGYEFYGARGEEAVRALARGGCWRLTLSADPREAIDLLKRNFGGAEGSFHHRYASLVGEIERHFPVAQWRMGDVPVWPLARCDLYVDMHRAAFGGAAPLPRALPLRICAALARPLVNRWRARRDPVHQLHKPAPADVVLLGDGVSLDRIDGAYQDRFGEPLIDALERQGKTVFLMQPGDLGRLPWRRKTFAASIVESKALLASLFHHGCADLPQHAEVIKFLAEAGVSAPSLSGSLLTRRARLVAAAAGVFEHMFRRVNPAMAFVVNAAAGLGPAFVLACRRRGILSIDLQRCPRAGAPMAYEWSSLPKDGYTVLPSIFWTWDASEAPHLPASPWHRDLHGGHTQLASFLRREEVSEVCRAREYEREILVALQPLGGDEVWNALAEVIVSAPATWRWRLRRHPAMRPGQDTIFGRLLSLGLENVVIDAASPLPFLLRRADVLVSLVSGAAVEASWFGVPALFLSLEAMGPFGALIASGTAHVVPVAELAAEIAALPKRPSNPRRKPSPPLEGTLLQLDALARDYRRQCGVAS